MDVILVINSGSSSLKFALYSIVENANDALLTGAVSGIGVKPELKAKMAGEVLQNQEPFSSIPEDADHEWLIKDGLCPQSVSPDSSHVLQGVHQNSGV